MSERDIERDESGGVLGGTGLEAGEQGVAAGGESGVPTDRGVTPDRIGEPLVRHHALLEYRGGAARVATLLTEGQARLGARAERSFEIPERAAAGGTPPAEAGRGLPAGAVLHLHSSADWPAALASALGHVQAGGRAVVTLHDCALCTGGCPYPLECRLWEQGCPGQCPRGYPGQAACAVQRDLLNRLRPLVICPSRWMAAMAARVLPDLERVVVPNGVEGPVAPLSRAEAKRRLGFTPGTALALFVAHGGEGAAYKCGGAWRELWRTVKSQAPGAAACLVGAVAPGAAARREEGDVFLWPYLERERLSLLMTAASVLVYPTLADNHPLVVLEAMRHGLAVAAWRVGGVPEQIRPGLTGLLRESGDFAGLARLAAELLNRPARAARLGEEARRLADAAFSAERLAANCLKAYARPGRTDPA